MPDFVRELRIYKILHCQFCHLESVYTFHFQYINSHMCCVFICLCLVYLIKTAIKGITSFTTNTPVAILLWQWFFIKCWTRIWWLLCVADKHVCLLTKKVCLFSKLVRFNWCRRRWWFCLVAFKADFTISRLEWHDTVCIKCCCSKYVCPWINFYQFRYLRIH